MSHTWQFFRAGGVDQVSLRDRADLLALSDLDEKLWVALAMPTRDLDIDPATLDLLDADKDARIRVPDILAAVTWIDEHWIDAGTVLKGGDLRIDTLKEGKVRLAAERIKKSGTITLDDVAAAVKAIAEKRLACEGATKQALEDLEATHGRDKPEAIDDFFAEVKTLADWARANHVDDAAIAAYDAVAERVDDYFAKCQLAAIDPELAAAANKVDPANIAAGPLAKIEPGASLPLGGAVNPAWEAKLEALGQKVVLPLLGARASLTEDDFRAVAAKLARPATKVEKLGIARVLALADGDDKDALAKLLADDKALEPEAAELASVEKAVRFQRDLGRVLRNFVNFSDFYSKSNAIFQAGTLYLDGRACRLCVAVSNADKHGTLAGMSAAYLVYCDLVRGAEKKSIVAAVTNGDADQLFVGRNGVFYDRKDQDWDATITKIVANPISIREAFWSPYKKLVRLIEDQVTKRAQAGEAAAEARMQATAERTANADKTASAPPPATPPPPAKKIDVGTVAAIGVAIGGIGALVVGVLATFFGLGKWMPIGLLALLLLISGPSMVLAWMKLRQRNLGPILHANGWAINGRARINVAFGAALTELPSLPKGARRTLDDPYADKRTPWRLYTFLIVLVLGAGSWYVGALDKYLPYKVKKTTVFDESTPILVELTLPAPPAPPPPA